MENGVQDKQYFVNDFIINVSNLESEYGIMSFYKDYKKIPFSKITGNPCYLKFSTKEERENLITLLDHITS